MEKVDELGEDSKTIALFQPMTLTRHLHAIVECDTIVR